MNEVADRLIAGKFPIKVFREYRGLTLAQLANQTRLTEDIFSLVETCNHPLEADIVKRITVVSRLLIEYAV